MARIIRIMETETERIFEVCFGETCDDSPQHKNALHRCWTWSLRPFQIRRPDGTTEDFLMTEDRQLEETILLARNLKRQIVPPPPLRVREVDIPVEPRRPPSRRRR